MTRSIDIQDLTREEIRWLLQRLFPYPEDMGPFESDRYKVVIRRDFFVDAKTVIVHPLPPPSSLVYYVELKYEKI
jgi:hypothetical protein